MKKMSYSVSSVLTNPLNFFERFKPPIGNLSSTKICGIALTIIASLGALYYLLSKSLFLEKEIDCRSLNNELNFLFTQEPFTQTHSSENNTRTYQGSKTPSGKIVYNTYPWLTNNKGAPTNHKIEISNQELTWGPINLSDESYNQYVIHYKQGNGTNRGRAYISNKGNRKLTEKEKSQAQRFFIEDIKAINYFLNNKPTIEAKPSSS